MQVRIGFAASHKLGVLPLPTWGEGWGEGVTGRGAKLMKGISEIAPDLRGLLRRQHAHACRLERIVRHTGRLRRRVERPAQMLAGMTRPDLASVMRQHLLVELVDHRELCRKIGRLLARAAGEIAGN